MKKLLTLMFLSAGMYASAQSFTINELTATGSDTLYHVVLGSFMNCGYTYDGYDVSTTEGEVSSDGNLLGIESSSFNVADRELREFVHALVTYRQSGLYDSKGNVLNTGNQFLSNPNQYQELLGTGSGTITWAAVPNRTGWLQLVKDGLIHRALWSDSTGEFQVLRASNPTSPYNFEAISIFRYGTAIAVNEAVFGGQECPNECAMSLREAADHFSSEGFNVDQSLFNRATKPGVDFRLFIQLNNSDSFPSFGSLDDIVGSYTVVIDSGDGYFRGFMQTYDCIDDAIERYEAEAVIPF